MVMNDEVRADRHEINNKTIHHEETFYLSGSGDGLHVCSIMSEGNCGG